MAQSETIKAATIEKQFNDLLSLYIYATFDDIKAGWEGIEKWPEITTQNYKNLATPKANRPKDAEGKEKKLTSVFTISTEVKQIFAKLFEKLIGELRNVDLADTDTITSVIEKVEDANAFWFSSFMFQLGAEYKSRFGTVLAGAADVSQWFPAKINGLLPQNKNKVVVMAQIGQAFDQFLKAVSWIMAKQLWYNQVSISQNYFLGLLASLNMEQTYLDDLQGGIRKKETKPRTTKAKTPTTDTATSAVADPGAKAPTDTVAEPEKPTTPVANATVDDIADLLDD